jgi:hypothetical protein
MRTITLTSETTYDVPAAAVWAVVADYARDVEWRDGVVSMVPSVPGPVRVGTTTAEVLRAGGRTWNNDGVVTLVEPGRRFEWRTTSGAVADGSRTVDALDGGRTRLRLQVHVTPTGVNRLLAPVLGPMLQRSLDRDLERLRPLVSAADDGEGPDRERAHAGHLRRGGGEPEAG